MLRSVRAIRYVMPFREGGSVPALVEGDDLGFYVVKLRGAGQGAKALVAELVAGEILRRVGLDVPELVFVDVAADLARSEPDPELSATLEASAGSNLGLDYLPGSITFDPVAGPAPDPDTASRIVLADAFVMNVDRTARNPNLLVWHRRIRPIDHGAAMYFHHGWTPASAREGSDDPFAEVADHVLLRRAKALPAAATHLDAVLSSAALEAIVGAIPAAWLDDRAFDDEASHRRAYLDWLLARKAALPIILEEAQRALAARPV